MAKDEKTGRSVHSSYTTCVFISTSLLAGDIILFDSHLAVFRHSLDVVFYLIAGPTENEIMTSLALNSLVDALSLLLRNQIEKRGLMENLDLVLLCLDETIDDGWVMVFRYFSALTNIPHIAFSGS
jgi:coatomer subunit zeta